MEQMVLQSTRLFHVMALADITGACNGFDSKKPAAAGFRFATDYYSLLSLISTALNLSTIPFLRAVHWLHFNISENTAPSSTSKPFVLTVPITTPLLLISSLPPTSIVPSKRPATLHYAPLIQSRHVHFPRSQHHPGSQHRLHPTVNTN